MRAAGPKLIPRKDGIGYLNPSNLKGTSSFYQGRTPNTSITNIGSTFVPPIEFTRQTPTFAMSSVPSTSVSQSSLKTRSFSYLQFLRIRPAADAVKKLFRKIKAAPLIRRFKSEYIPYEEWKAMYISEHPDEAVSSAKEGIRRSSTVFDYEFTDNKKRAPTHDSVRSERLTPDDTDTLGTYQETGHEDVLDGQITAAVQSKPKNTASLDVENGLFGNVSPPDLVYARAAKTSSSNQNAPAKVDSETCSSNKLVTIPLDERESDSASTVGWSEYGFGRDYDLTYY